MVTAIAFTVIAGSIAGYPQILAITIQYAASWTVGVYLSRKSAVRKQHLLASLSMPSSWQAENAVKCLAGNDWGNDVLHGPEPGICDEAWRGVVGFFHPFRSVRAY